MCCARLSLALFTELGRPPGPGESYCRSYKVKNLSMSGSLTPDDIAALESVVDWWAGAGVETLPPLPEEARRKPAPPQSPPSPSLSRPVATPQDARAAGFGPAPDQDGRAMADAAADLPALQAALADFNGCALKATARNLVFARGDPNARVMIIGEAPGRDEDAQGAPFVGRAGQLLDKMLAAIGLDETSAYITNVVFWRPPGNRKPTDQEIEACRPFTERHIALVDPDVLVFAGGISTQAMLRTKSGIMSQRGRWMDYELPGGAKIPALPIFHPAFLLRRPQEKAKAWADLLSLKARLEG